MSFDGQVRVTARLDTLMSRRMLLNRGALTLGAALLPSIGAALNQTEGQPVKDAATEFAPSHVRTRKLVHGTVRRKRLVRVDAPRRKRALR